MVSSKFIEDLIREAGNLTLKYFRKPLHSEEKQGHKGIVSEADIATEKLIVSRIKSSFPDHHILAEEGSPELLNGSRSGMTWIIDPIDGTTNFVQGNVYYCVSIGLYEVIEGRSRPVLGSIFQPSLDNLYLAESGGGAFLNGKPIAVSHPKDPKKATFGTGFAYNTDENLKKVIGSIAAVRSLDPCTTIRINGAAALDMARTAEGILDAFWEFNLSPWDMAAGNLIVQEAGGVVTNFRGEEFDPLRDRNVICGSRETHRLLAELIRPIFT